MELWGSTGERKVVKRYVQHGLGAAAAGAAVVGDDDDDVMVDFDAAREWG